MKTVPHPFLPAYTLSFDPESHTYRDNHGDEYVSVTTLVKRYFPPFDEKAALESVAASTGRLEMDIAAEWKDKREKAASFGSRVHEYAEAIVKGVPDIPKPCSDSERHAFSIVDKSLVALERHYEFYGAEQIIYDPLYRVAGTIDLPARNKQTGALAILDWKTCEAIPNDAYGRRALPPIEDILDSKQARYQLQASTYGWIMTARGYTPYTATEGDAVEIALIHIPHIGTDPVWRPLAYLGDHAQRIMQHHFDTIVLPEETMKENPIPETIAQ